MIDFSEHAHGSASNVAEILEHYKIDDFIDSPQLEETYGIMVQSYMQNYHDKSFRHRNSFPEPSQAYMFQLSQGLTEAAKSAMADDETYLSLNGREMINRFGEENHALLAERLEVDISAIENRKMEREDWENLAKVWCETAKEKLGKLDEASVFETKVEEAIYLDNVSTGSYSSLCFDGVEFPELAEFRHSIAHMVASMITKEDLVQTVKNDLALMNGLDKTIQEEVNKEELKAKAPTMG